MQQDKHGTVDKKIYDIEQYYIDPQKAYQWKVIEKLSNEPQRTGEAADDTRRCIGQNVSVTDTGDTDNASVNQAENRQSSSGKEMGWLTILPNLDSLLKSQPRLSGQGKDSLIL